MYYILAYYDTYTEPHETRGLGVSATFREERMDEGKSIVEFNMCCP